MLLHVIAIGVQTWSTDVAALRRYWQVADDLGYARLTYGDGLWSFTHDGWTMLAALACATRRARVGHAVTYAFDRAAHHPSWLAKRAVAIDHLSGGRFDLRLAVGAEDRMTAEAWRSHGIPYPRAGERLVALQEAVTIVRRLWRGETVHAPGPHFPLSGATVAPAPIQRPGPPIWIAAVGPRALDVAARHADGWEASLLSPEAFARAAARVDAGLRAAGRPPEAVRRSVELDVALVGATGDRGTHVRAFCAARGVAPGHPLLETALIGDADDVVERIAAYAAVGATDLMLGFADFPATGMLQAFAASVLPRLGAPAAASAPARRGRRASR
jgi:alkanesulfonate monooxygenase SsuD/methylene tetrahydromethanopterin reductase-like flavin-dependent oxidoreductase (luciferase family)